LLTSDIGYYFAIMVSTDRAWPNLLKQSVFQNTVEWGDQSASSVRFHVKSQPKGAANIQDFNLRCML